MTTVDTVEFFQQPAAVKARQHYPLDSVLIICNTMNPLRSLCVMAFLVAAVCGNQQSGNQQSMKPSQWLSSSLLQQAPLMDEVSLNRLENMPLEKGAKLMETIYQLSQINWSLRPTFVPSANSISVYIVKPNGQKIATTLDKLAATCKQQPNFGEEEVTIFITGLPARTDSIKKANHKLVHAYLQRYNVEKSRAQSMIAGSQEADSNEDWSNVKKNTGNLVIIDLGETLTTFKRYATLDIESTGAMIGDQIVKLTEKCNVPNEIIHIVAQNMAAHVAGSAANEFTRHTGNQLRRITALDPSKIFAKNPQQVTGLSRGDAEFVDAIHTSVYGLGTAERVGDVDFYPNGPSAGVPGAESVVEASMRATRYFAESVRPGNERNFPAVAANSLNEYKNNNGYGKRCYMGIDTDFDLEGDYMLEVNAQSPFGKSTRAQKQTSYHGMHMPLSWQQ